MTREELVQSPEYWKSLYEDECYRLSIEPNKVLFIENKPKANRLEESFEKFKAYIESPEGQADLDDYAKKLDNEEKFLDRWCEKLHCLSISDKLTLFTKVTNKYRSVKYQDRWYTRGIEPPEDLLWMAYHYARRYGINDPDGYEMFASEVYKVDNVFQVVRYDGQGSFIRVSLLNQPKKMMD